MKKQQIWLACLLIIVSCKYQSQTNKSDQVDYKSPDSFRTIEFTSKTKNDIKRYIDSVEDLSLDERRKVELKHQFIMSRLNASQKIQYEIIREEKWKRFRIELLRDIRLSENEEEALSKMHKEDYNQGQEWTFSERVYSAIKEVTSEERLQKFKNLRETRIQRQCTSKLKNEESFKWRVEKSVRTREYLEANYIPGVLKLSTKLKSGLSNQEKVQIRNLSHKYQAKIDRAERQNLLKFLGHQDCELNNQTTYWKEKFRKYRVKPDPSIYWGKYFYPEDVGDKTEFDEMLSVCESVTVEHSKKVKRIKKAYDKQKKLYDSFLDQLNKSNQASVVTVTAPPGIQDIEWLFELLFITN